MTQHSAGFAHFYQKTLILSINRTDGSPENKKALQEGKYGRGE